MTMRNREKKYRVALVTENLWRMAGANRVLASFAEMFPEADIYALFGREKDKEKYLSSTVCSHKICYSKLNRIPFIRKIYRYTYPLWIHYIEKFDFSEYDLVISSSSSVSHGVLTPLECKHISYIHTPMRYVWDLNQKYFKSSKFGFSFPVRIVSKIFFNFSRLWDVVASNRSDILISNSKYVKKRIHKYWGKDVHSIVYPPMEKYTGKIRNERDNYFVSGAPFDENKCGDFLLECAKSLGFNLKIIGTGNMKKKLKMKYRNSKNIEFLGWISEEKKFDVLSNALGYIIPGIEDYGIFPVEAMSCGTPVLAYKGGGSLETVQENVSGIFFDDYSIASFEKGLNSLKKRKWNYKQVSESLVNMNDSNSFKDEIRKILVDNGIYI